MSGKTVFDFGLHRGEDTDFYLRKGYRVVAIEANAALVASCRDKFAAAIESGQLLIVEGAVAPDSAESDVKFYINKKKSVWGTIHAEWASRNQNLGAESEVVSVPRINIGELMKEDSEPYYVKIDIEGADVLVLETLVEIGARPQYLSVESDKRSLEAVEREVQLMLDLGFTRFMAVQQALIPGSTIRTRRNDGREIEYRFLPDASGPFGEDLRGEWVSKDELMTQYEDIFHRYRRYGDYSPIRKYTGKYLCGAIQAMTGIPMPGWYDTHAKR